MSTGSPSMVRLAPAVVGGVVGGLVAGGLVTGAGLVRGVRAGVVVGTGAAGAVGAVVPSVGGGAVAGGVVRGAATLAPADLVGAPGVDWNDASAPRPTTVMMMAGTVRRIAGRLQLEALEMDVVTRHAELAEAPPHRVDERGRPADEAFAARDVGNATARLLSGDRYR